MTKLICLSDTHNQHEKLTEDLLKIHKEFNDSILIHVGDACLEGSKKEAENFINWFGKLPFSKKIFIPGNHDMAFEKNVSFYFLDLLRLAIEFNIEIWQNNIYQLNDYKVLVSNHIPFLKSWAFFSEDYERKRFFEYIDNDADIVFSHNPPYGLGDRAYRSFGKYEHVGCKFLKKYIDDNEPKLVINGHIHESFGLNTIKSTKVYNVAILDERYKVKNPITIIDI